MIWVDSKIITKLSFFCVALHFSAIVIIKWLNSATLGATKTYSIIGLVSILTVFLIVKMNGFKELTISFFGDGATEEGVFHECLNFSSLKKLPIAFVCLNNELAVDVKIENRQSYKIKNLVKSYKIKYYKVSSFEIDNVCKVYLDAKKYIYKYKKPVFIEVNYYRHLQHIGLLSDFDQSQSSFERANYRSKKAHEKNIKQDPFLLISNKVKKKYGNNYVEKFLNKKKDEAEKIIKKVKLSRFTKFNEILKY